MTTTLIPPALDGAATFPLRGPAAPKASKAPAVKAWQNHTGGHGTAPAYGINCARSGLVVIDLDTKHGQDGPAAWAAWLADLEREAPATLEQATPNGDGRARHLIYRAHPTVHVPMAGAILPGVDLRAGWTDEAGKAVSAGYIVGPGSTILKDDGTPGTYRVTADRPVAELPKWLARGLLDLIETKAPAPAPAAPAPTVPMGADRWLAAAIDGALADLADTAAMPDGAVDPHGRSWETGALHARACRLVELSNVDPGAYPLEQARADYCAAAPAGHETRFARHWEDAVKRVGNRAATRPEPRTASLAAEFATAAIAVAAPRQGTSGPAQAQATKLLDVADPTTGIGEQHRGQARIAYRLAATYPDRLMHVHGIGWFAWDGTRWTEDTGQAQNAVLDVLRAALAESIGDEHGNDLRADVRKCETANGMKGVLSIAAALPGLAATVDQLDADPYLLNCANGTLDLHTLELRPHAPGDRITKACRAAYDPDAAGETWARFLSEVLPDESVRAYFQRFAGLALLGEVREHVFTIATGTGRNGKGVAYGALLHALGDYGHAAERDLFAQVKSNPNAASPALLGLRGRRLVVVSETENHAKVAPALMKALTGGDPINARPLYGKPVTFDPAHTALMVTNFLPKLPADDPAVWSRVRVIPFDVVIPPAKRDTQLGRRLTLEAESVLAWAVAGLADYLAHGLREPAAVQHATANYEAAQDDVRRFIDAACYTGYGVGETVTRLHQAYTAWAAADGVERPLSRREFGDALDRHGHPTRKSGSRRIRDGIALAATDSLEEIAVNRANAGRGTEWTDESLSSSRARDGEVRDPSVRSVPTPPEDPGILCPGCLLPNCAGDCLEDLR